ncbi:Pleiotropic drug resistance protein 1 [Camellia lanceoleosa]|uniref:Pleiotropic drug resistance protein 1 n=1 Tax=Camellia lanceoleosa TaxID=1840588 RepID=A0ACC0FRA3_9ERIC|nr:Pleiotropic drug resistance protein 1 [Camellia lanceoleosa]
MANVQAAVYGRPDCVLDSELFKEIVDYKVAEHQQRIKLAFEEEEDNEDDDCSDEDFSSVNSLTTEQRKRLTIAVELVANLSIIFISEPTSGLDTRAAAIVMRTVRNTIDIGRKIVYTIHQPCIDIFKAFD